MPFPRRVESLRTFADWESKEVPTDLLLAIVQRESGGVIGRQGGGKTKCAQLPSRGGGMREICTANGLTQIVPRTALAWNEAGNNPQVTVEDLTDSDERAARIQLMLGAWVLSSALRFVHNYDPKLFPSKSFQLADSNQIKLAILGYRMGVGALKKKLELLKFQHLPLTYDQIKTSFPNWGYSTKENKWFNRPIMYTDHVWESYQLNRITGPEHPAKPPILPMTEIVQNTTWLIPVALIGAIIIYSIKTQHKR